MNSSIKAIKDALAQSGRPLSFKELTRSLDVHKDKREAFKKELKGLISLGELIKVRGGRYGVPSKMHLVTGRFICHPDGYGFVSPEDGEGEDIYIGQRKVSGAMHSDTVLARIDGVKEGGRREGRIVRIVERANKRLSGRIELSRGYAVVIPSESRIVSRVIVPLKESLGAKDNDIVIVEITRWPGPDTPPAGKVVEILGSPDDPEVETRVILEKYGLSSRFPEGAWREAEKIAQEISDAEAKRRVDLRDKRIITIDGETAKDFDDAVCVERTDKHGYRLWVSIADVAHYVKEGSALDTEAYARSTSVYFPDKCVPMLPEALSNGICSLKPNEDRLTLTAELTFDSTGELVHKKLCESVIRSVERMTYTNVYAILQGKDEALNNRYAHIAEDLKLMLELSEKLFEKRKKAGSIDFDLPEPQIIIDIEGRVEDIVRSERNAAHRIIEEFMLSANRAVAEEFSRPGLPFIYRVHDEPDEESIDEFAEFVSGFGLTLKKHGPKAFQEVLKSAEGRKEERLINHVLLRSMKQAAYSPDNIGHFGLAFEDYTHFTSPIRRYPDLVVHRLVKLLLHRAYTKDAQERMETLLPAIASHTSAKERKAMEAEREIADLKKAQFMADKVGEEFGGFISGVTGFGFFVELSEYFVEGLVRVSTLLDDYYVFDDKRHCLTGERTKRVFRVGDEVRVSVSSVDLERKRIDFELVDEAIEKLKRRGPRQRTLRQRR